MLQATLLKNAQNKRQQREKMNQEYRHREETLELYSKKLSYPNQKETAFEVIAAYDRGSPVVCMVAQPGTGKTGASLEIGYRMGTHPSDDKIIDLNKIIMLSGMADKQWQKQMEENMLSSLSKNVHHRGQLKQKTIIKKLQDLENGILIIDECHIASGVKMTLDKELKKAGLLNIDYLNQKNIKLLVVSATPESMLENTKQWGDKAELVILKPGPTYKGFQSMIDEGRIRDAPELTTKPDVNKFLDIFEERYDGMSKRFFIMRGLKTEALDWVRSYSIDNKWDLMLYDSVDTIENIDEVMSSSPDKHTIISIKEYWRASKRLKQTWIGGTYEKPPIKRNTSATAQGLTARLCDNFEYEGELLNPDLRPLHFCDVTAIEEYLTWYNNGCIYSAGTYTSANIKSKNGKVKSRKSVLHPSNIDNLVQVPDETTLAIDNYNTSDLLENQSDAIEWSIHHINWEGTWNTERHRRATNVGIYDSDGRPGNTHFRSRGKSLIIPTVAEFREERDLSKFGSGVRCVPIKKNEHELLYTIIYKTSWLRVSN